MKKIFCLVLSLAALAARAFVPEVGYQPNFLTIDSIECTPQATRMSVTLSNRPHYWVKIDSASVLTDEATGNTYKIIGQENLPLSQEIWMPESGQHSGVIICEPIPDGVKSLSFSEPDSKPENKVYGIRLDRERQIVTNLPGEDRSDVLAWPAPAEKWDAFDAKKYAQMEFYKPGSKAVVCGRIANIPPGYTTTLRTNNYITDTDYMTLVEFDADGNFSVEVPLDYPQIAYMHLGRANVFFMVIPGDTTEFYSTTRSNLDQATGSFKSEYCKVLSNNPDVVAITSLLDDVEDRFVDPRADFGWWYKKLEGGLDTIMAVNAGFKADLPDIISRAEAGIGEYPISPFAKDFLFTYAVVKNYMPIADMDMYWRDNHYIQTKDEEDNVVLLQNPDFVPVDVIKYYGGQEAYQDLIYDNPLVLCVEYIMVNRAQYSELFHWQDLALDGLKKLPDFGGDLDEIEFGGGNVYENIKRFAEQRKQAMGLGDCFMQQMVIANSLCQSLKHVADQSEYSLKNNATLLGEALPLISCRPLIAQIITSYGKLATDYGRKLGGNSTGTVIDVDSDVLSALIEPYAGRVIYIDVWDITCGPCRGAILEQKPLLQKYADEPFTVIYVAPEYSKDRCESWLADNEIKGEHIYLSQNNYNRLCSVFNIAGIPFGILVGKNGQVLQTGMHSFRSNDIDPLLK